ncbi:hypothetical protein NEOLEDRAFT_1181522 [Neolentinus lepideus HHB14362 ss-1]|uniref:Uncharacterized protein n=1 Tax=Neolentinus lepideus HHB14362 ss-1 TaxID=1314782 RepID=A0A165PYX3_9AGAM|nr:hypothetical protein NEOLEDRAFT_1181522 [Neolentinus lepideus HHB14362 ss-1]
MRASTIALGLVAAALSPTLVSCAPFPVPDGGSASTSAGGNASGGSVNSPPGQGLGLLNVFSSEAGNGGIANSSEAVGGSPHQLMSASRVSRPRTSAKRPKQAFKANSPATTANDASTPHLVTKHAGDGTNAGVATSGEGAQVDGGPVDNAGGALGVFNNGGNAKRSNPSFSPSFGRSAQKKRTNGGSANTQQGGNASGGSVNEGDCGATILNMGSNNAGDGGLAASRNANGGIARVPGPKPAAVNGGEATAGVGGYAPGGSVNGPKGLINMFSNNAGHGGDGSSGSAIGGRRL